MTSLLHVGAARSDITFFEPGMPMLGWGIQSNVSRGVHTPLQARVFVFHDTDADRRVVYGCLDLSMITDALRLSVLERIDVRAPELGVRPDTLMLTATHTHSGPGGYGHHLFYNLPNPGHSPRVLRGIVERVCDAIVEAAARARPAVLRVAAEHVPTTEPIGFNRSVAAYNRNRDVEPVSSADRARAVDRDMVVLRVDGADGTPIGLVDWFPLHGTSVHSDNTLVHPDNKGAAALATERALGGDAVAAFAQAASGDVSPNFRWDRNRRRAVGVSDDDFESADIAGDIQHRYAMRAWARAGESDPEPPLIDIVTLHVDMRGLEVDTRYTRGTAGCRTGAARVGVTFLEGTREGPGPLLALPFVSRAARWLAGLHRGYASIRRRLSDDPRWVDVHGPKFTFLGVGDGAVARAFGCFRADRPALPGAVDPVVWAMKRFDAIEAVSVREWAPNVLVLQLLRIGSLAVVGLPVEPTTVAGRRVAASVREAAAELGVERVVVAGYTNGYAGYVTTDEEYQLQLYEGASTLHGQWSLAAYQTRLDALVGRLRDRPEDRDRDPGPAIRRPRAAEIYAQTWDSGH